MRQRRKIARCPDRALRRDHRQTRRAPACPRSAAITSRRTPDAPRPSDSSFSTMIRRTVSRLDRLAHAAAMRQDQVALQRGGILRRDLDRGEFAKAGIDAVDRRVALRRRPECGRRRRRCRAGRCRARRTASPRRQSCSSCASVVSPGGSGFQDRFRQFASDECGHEGG